jgi:hypothetical protein
MPEAVARIRAELARGDADPRATKKGGALHRLTVGT